jgi:hypothetical protein
LDVRSSMEGGTPLAQSRRVSKKPDRTASERLKLEAQALATAGKLTAALEAYGRAAEVLPHDAWLHHAAGELAKKLKQDGLAAIYFRKSGAAFMASGFSRYALPALRSSWLLFRSGLPSTAGAYREVTHELAAVQRELGFQTDAAMTEELGRGALEELTASERGPDDSVPPRESLARTLRTSVAPRRSAGQGFRRWLERVRKALSA